ncbi:MAG: hypothetical protein OXH77_02770 [Anaerolineaceae bacterium]|nr:hypothetical protein [Anaerolineaceae bacterium]
MDLEQDFAINANVLHHPKSGFWLDEENMFMAVVLSIREGGDINATATRMGSIISEVVTSLALEESRLPADS